MSENMLELRGINKNFGETRALNGADFALKAGEIHALLGENGAGKSTLIRIIAGAHQPDSGQILINNSEVKIRNPHESQSLGLSVVYQETSLCPDLSVLENLYLGRPIIRYGIINWSQMYKNASNLLSKLGMGIPLSSRLGNLGKATAQQVEIARALLHGAKIIILDEPGSVLNTEEMSKLHTLLKESRDQGAAVVYITHRLEEVFKIADRVTVMRDGKTIDSKAINEIDEKWIIKGMVGREISHLYDRNLQKTGECVLKVENLSSGASVKNVSLTIHKGEIVGIAGLVGAGRNELALCISGLQEITSGTVEICGKTSPKKVSEIQKAGLGYVPADRLRQGLFWSLSIKRNVTIGIFDRFKKGIFLDRQNQKKLAEELVSKLTIKTTNSDNAINTLSGGNAQKALLAKILATEPEILILEEPTTGVDIGAKQEIHKLIDQLVGKSLGILLISSDLPELLGMSDRVLVMREGEIVGEFPRGASSEEVMALTFSKAKVSTSNV